MLKFVAEDFMVNWFVHTVRVIGRTSVTHSLQIRTVNASCYGKRVSARILILPVHINSKPEVESPMRCWK